MRLLATSVDKGESTFVYDSDVGAVVFSYRNYRADLGRWMSADPTNFPDGPNQDFSFYVREI